MNFCYFVFILTFVSFSKHDTFVRIVYESHHNESIQFLMDQVVPVWSSIFDDVEEELIVQMMPFGFGRVRHSHGKNEFWCEKSPNNCFGNKVHACAFETHRKPSVFRYIACLGAWNVFDFNVLVKCANQSDVAFAQIQSCLSSGRADDLLTYFSKLSESFGTNNKQIPNVLFNGGLTTKTGKKGVINFRKEMCKRFKVKPYGCLTE